MRKVPGRKSEMSEATGSGRDSYEPIASTSIVARSGRRPSRAEGIEHYLDIIRKYDSKFLQTHSREAHRNVSSTFLARLRKIDTNSGGNLFMKLIMYQEWVDMLLNMNDSLTQNVKKLETEVSERMHVIQTLLDDFQCGEILSHYRNDIKNLVQIVKNGYYNNDWNINVHLETVNLADILDCRERVKSAHSQIVTTLEVPVESYESCESNFSETEIKLEVEVIPDQNQKSEKEMEKEEIGTTSQNVVNRSNEDNTFSLRPSYKGVSKSSTNLGDNSLDISSRMVKSDSHISTNVYKLQEINVKYQIGKTLTLNQDPYTSNLKDTAEDAERENLMYPLQERESKMPFHNLSFTELGSKKELKVGDSLCALAAEVAAKHDELRMLNKQVMSLEDEVQKSFQKIQLKDDVIRELRLELKPLKLQHKQKREAYHKLDYLRQQLTRIVQASDRELLDCIQQVESQLTPDGDDVALSALRKLIVNYRTQIESNEVAIYEIRMVNTEMEAALKSSKDRNCKSETCLKEITDYLTNILGKPVSFHDIYRIEPPPNPICCALLKFKEQCEKNVVQYKVLLESKESRLNEAREELSAMEAILLREQQVAESRNEETTGRHHLNNTPDTPSSC